MSISIKSRRKKKVSAALIIAALVLGTSIIVAGCTAPSPDKSSDAVLASSALSDQKSILRKYTKQPILYFESFLTDNGQNVSFAIVSGEDSNQGDVYYITDSGAEKLKSGIHFPEDNKPEEPFIWSVGNVKLFKCESNGGGSGSLSYAWYIKDGKGIELSNVGERLNYNGNGQFTTIGADFDSGITEGMKSGHTYKKYYLYWANDRFKEYGGMKITRQQLLKVKGAQEIFDVITKSGNTVDDIYYRANNIININLHSGDNNNCDFDNVTLEFKNNTVTPLWINKDAKAETLSENNLHKFSYGGIYKPSLYPQIATYPDSFPIDKK